MQILEKGSPYPLIILPQFGGYWIEDPENLGTPTSSDSSICEEEEENLSPSTYGYKLECKGEARAYRKHFLGKVGSSAPRGSKLHTLTQEKLSNYEQNREILQFPSLQGMEALVGSQRGSDGHTCSLCPGPTARGLL